MAMKKYLYISLFLTLITFKVSAIHVYLHNDHDDEHIDDCELCEYTIYNQNIEFSAPPQFQGFEIDYIPTFCQQENHYESVCITTFINDVHFGRPPPFLM